MLSTKNELTPLLLKTGKLWHEVKGEDVATIRLEADKGKNCLKADIRQRNGQTVNGIVPFELKETWKSGNYFWIQGITSKFGQPAKFNVKLNDLILVETLEGTPKRFRIKTEKGEMTAQNLEFGLYGSMPYSSPKRYGFLSNYNSLEIKSESLDIEMPLKDILRFTFDEKGEITMVTKGGESGKVSFKNVERIYGRLKTGGVLFHSILHTEEAKIKSIEFHKQTPKAK